MVFTVVFLSYSNKFLTKYFYTEIKGWGWKDCIFVVMLSDVCNLYEVMRDTIKIE